MLKLCWNLGLRCRFASEQVQSELVLRYNIQNLEDIRVIKDKATGIIAYSYPISLHSLHRLARSKGYAFIRFPTLDDATSFMNANYPEIRIDSSNSTSDTHWVRIAYSRERSDRESYAEWTCRFVRRSSVIYEVQCADVVSVPRLIGLGEQSAIVVERQDWVGLLNCLLCLY